MGTPRKLLLFAATVWPLVYMFLFFGAMAAFVVFAAGQTPSGGTPPSPPSGPPTWFVGLFAAHLATMLLMLALAVFYVVHAYRSDRIPESRRVLWVVLNIIGGFIAQLVYWYLFIWREPKPLETAPAPDRAPGW